MRTMSSKQLDKAIDKALKEEKITISKETARRNIAEWLYTNDGGYPSKTAWRVALIRMLEWNIKHIK